MFKEKRELIIETALSVFMERGYEGVTIESIADALGYTKPALYYYFKNKDELISSMVLKYLNETHERIRQIYEQQQTSKERLRDLLWFSLEQNSMHSGYFAMHHHLSRLIEYTQNTAQFEEIQRLSQDITHHIIEIMTQGVSRKEFLDKDPVVLGTIIRGMISGVLMLMGTPPLASMDPTTLKTIICDMIIKGIET